MLSSSISISGSISFPFDNLTSLAHHDDGEEGAEIIVMKAFLTVPTTSTKLQIGHDKQTERWFDKGTSHVKLRGTGSAQSSKNTAVSS